MSEKQETLRRSALLLTAAGLASQVLSFFYRVAVTRMVGAELLGVQQMVLQVYGLLQSIALTGLTVAVSSLTAGFETLGNRRAAAQVLQMSIRMLWTLWLPIALALVLYADELSRFVLSDRRTELSLLLLLPLLLLTGIENLNKHYFYGLRRSALPAAVELCEQLVRTAAILLLLRCFLPLSGAHTVALIFVGMLVSEVFSSVTLTLLRRREGAAADLAGTPQPKRLLRRRICHVALPIGATAVLDNLMEAAGSILIPRQLTAYGLSTTAAMELYGVIFGMTMPLLLLPFAFVRALSLALLPRITLYATQRRTALLNATAERCIFITALILLPVTALLVTVGSDLGLLLFHDVRAGDYLLPLSLVTSLSGVQSILSAVLTGLGRQHESALVSLLCGLIQLSCTLFAVSRFGIAACLVGMLVCALLGFGLRLRLVRRATGFSPDLFLCLWGPGLGALLSGLCCNLLYRFLRDGGYSGSVCLVSCAGLCALLYLSALQAMGIRLRQPSSTDYF